MPHHHISPVARSGEPINGGGGRSPAHGTLPLDGAVPVRVTYSLCALRPEPRSCRPSHRPGTAPGREQPGAPLGRPRRLGQDWLGRWIREEVRLLPPLPAPPPPPSSASTLHPFPSVRSSAPSSAPPAAAWMWARDKCSAPPLEMDSRYTSATGIGDLNQLSAAIPATRVEVSVSCR